MDILSIADPERICMENRGFVHWVINTYFPGYRYDEDFFQTAWIGLWEATKNFDESRGVKFQTFAQVFIKRRCCDELKRRCRQDKLPTVSINSNISGTDLTYLDAFTDRVDVDGTVIDEIFVEQLLETVQKSGLTEMQLNIITLRLQGLTLNQISKSVGTCVSRVSQNIKVIKQAVNEALVEIY